MSVGRKMLIQKSQFKLNSTFIIYAHCSGQVNHLSADYNMEAALEWEKIFMAKSWWKILRDMARLIPTARRPRMTWAGRSAVPCTRLVHPATQCSWPARLLLICRCRTAVADHYSPWVPACTWPLRTSDFPSRKGGAATWPTTTASLASFPTPVLRSPRAVHSAETRGNQ